MKMEMMSEQEVYGCIEIHGEKVPSALCVPSFTQAPQPPIWQGQLFPPWPSPLAPSTFEREPGEAGIKSRSDYATPSNT